MENNSSFITLKSRSNYLSIRKFGHRIHTKNGLIFNFQLNNLSYSRIGWTLPKYVGNAVQRNRLKRYCRESSRKLSQKINSLCLDVNIVFAKKGKDNFKNLRCLEVEESITEFISKYNKKF